MRTLLPLCTWSLQKQVGPVFKPDHWQAVALSFVPPPDSIINEMSKAKTGLNPIALLSPAARRRVRKVYERELILSLRGNRMAASTRDYMVAWFHKLEADGQTPDPARVRKLRVIEAETNQHFSELTRTHELGKWLVVDGDREHDIIALLWEFTSTGQGGQKPKLTKRSPLWKILGIDPEQLESLPEEEVIPMFFSRWFALLGFGEESPDERKLVRLLHWVISTHLSSDWEPKTTPRALGKAVSSGLVLAGHQTRDKETDKVEVQVEDPDSARFIKEIEAKDELDRLVAKAKFSRGERIVFDGMREGLRGESLGGFVEGHGVSPSSVKVLTNRVLNKLRASKK